MAFGEKYILLLLAFFTVHVAKSQHLEPIDSLSKVHFVIKNFGINTGGDLSGISGIIEFDAASPANAFFDVTVESRTVDTDNNMRDSHLRDDAYFDAARFPHIAIRSERVRQTRRKDHYVFSGTLTLKGISKKVEFPFTAVSRDGGYLFKAKFSINRMDYGVGSNSVSLSDKVNIQLTVFAK